MPLEVLLQLLLLTVAYGFVFALLAKLLQLGGLPVRWIFLADGAIFGAVSGLLVVWIWPLDSASLVNVYAILLGDLVYNTAIAWLGDPSSSQAHTTVPWLLRVPQVYLAVSFVLAALTGGLIQWRVNRLRTETQQRISGPA